MDASAITAAVSTLVPPDGVFNVTPGAASAPANDQAKFHSMAYPFTYDCNDGSMTSDFVNVVQWWTHIYRPKPLSWPSKECLTHTHPADRLRAQPLVPSDTMPVPPCTIAHHPLHQTLCVSPFRAILSGDGEQIQLLHQGVRLRRDFSSKEVSLSRSSAADPPSGTIFNAVAAHSTVLQSQPCSISFYTLTCATALLYLLGIIQLCANFGEWIASRLRYRAINTPTPFPFTIPINTIVFVTIAGAIMLCHFACVDGSCLDMLVQMGCEYLLGVILAKLRINLVRASSRLARQAANQHKLEVALLTFTLLVQCTQAVEEGSAEYTKLLNVDIWDGVPSPYFRLSSGWFSSLRIALANVFQDGDSLLRCAKGEDIGRGAVGNITPFAPAVPPTINPSNGAIITNGTAAVMAVPSQQQCDGHMNRVRRLYATILQKITKGSTLFLLFTTDADFMANGIA
eukprot:71020-Prymnesium_polylepis.1